MCGGVRGSRCGRRGIAGSCAATVLGCNRRARQGVVFAVHRYRPVARGFVHLWRAVVGSRGAGDKDGLHLKTSPQRRRLQLSLGRDVHLNVNGTLLSAAALPGWRVTRDGHRRQPFRRPAAAGLSAHAIRSRQPPARVLRRRAVRGGHLVPAQPGDHGRAQRHCCLRRSHRVAARRDRHAKFLSAGLHRTRGAGDLVRRIPGGAPWRASNGVALRWARMERRRRLGHRSDRRAGPYLRLGFSARY